MRRLFIAGALLVCVLVLVSAVGVGPASAQPRSADWTFLVYMCSDNDLDYWGEVNNEWLMSVGSNDNVHFLVFWDKSTAPAMLYRIVHRAMDPVEEFSLSGTEVNMGSPEVLNSLLSFVEREFPSDHLVLDLWDHGDDFRGICFDHVTGTNIALDYLSHQEIGDVLAGHEVSILAADGCGIGIIEAAYEYVVRGARVEYFVANENYVPLQGFPYDAIASDLVANPGMTPEELSVIIVQRYAELYTKGWLTELAAIRMTEVQRVVSELWDVTSLLVADMAVYKGMLSSGRAQATMGWSQYGWEAYVDFPTVFEVVYERSSSGSDLMTETRELLSAIEDMIVLVGSAWPAEVWDPEGISVFFPPAHGSYKHNTFWRGSLYPSMAFAQDGWLELLEAYYAAR